MVSIKGIVTAFVITLLMIYGLLSLAIYIQVENNAPISVSDDSFVNQSFREITSSIYEQQSAEESQSQAFEIEQPKEANSEEASDSINTGTKKLKGISVTKSLNLLSTMIETKLGIPSIVMYAGGIIIGVTMLLLMWKAIRWGE